MDFFRISRRYKTARRLQTIVNVFLRHGFGQFIDQIQLGKYIPFRKRLKSFGQWPALKGPTVPERLRIAFAELGPSFIKLAQTLGSRPDLITPRYADEFKKLQDSVPPFSGEEAVRIIEEELKRPLSDVFMSFSERPIAAASIAQVHTAVLFDGTEVVVKVQRPEIKETLEQDIDLMQTLADLLEHYIPEARFFNIKGVVQEFSKTVRREIDFTEEGRNCNRIRRIFEGNPDILIPMIFPGLSTEKVLVMQRIHGAKIDDISSIEAMGLDRKRLARIGVDAYFKMILDAGFFHADPHPGNIFALSTGQLAFVDFGMVGRVTEELKESMASSFIALMNRDFDKLIDGYIEMGLVPEDMDLDAFRRDFKTDLMDFLEPLYGMTIGEINFAEYLDIIVRLAMKHRMKVPSDMLLVNKAMLILQNIGVQLDPNFDFMAAAGPYAQKLVKNRYGPKKLFGDLGKNFSEITDFVALVPRQLKKLMRKALKDDLHIKMTHIGLDRLIKDMDRSSNRIAFALVISSIILSSAIMHAAKVGPTIFDLSILGILTFGFAFLLGIWLIISIIRSGRL